jgi:hypothetical protein
MKAAALLIICIQDTGAKVESLNEAIDFAKQLDRLEDKKFKYIFEDKENGHQSETDYRMIVVKK